MYVSIKQNIEIQIQRSFYMSKELIDVLDENGVKTGEVLERDEIHRKGLWHRSIVVAILNEKNEILLQQRSANKEKNAGMWDISVAGHVSTGQDSLSAAIREMEEEVSIHLDNPININTFRYLFSYKTQKKYANDFIESQFFDFFLVRKEGLTIEDIKIQESELQAVKFVTLDEFITMYHNKMIVERKPVYDELINYLHR